MIQDLPANTSQEDKSSPCLIDLSTVPTTRLQHLMLLQWWKSKILWIEANQQTFLKSFKLMGQKFLSFLFSKEVLNMHCLWVILTGKERLNCYLHFAIIFVLYRAQYLAYLDQQTVHQCYIHSITIEYTSSRLL